MAIREIEARTQPGDPIFVGPLLTGLYVVSGRENPLRQISLLPSALRADQVVADLVYHPIDTQLLQEARTRGARTVDGLQMLDEEGDTLNVSGVLGLRRLAFGDVQMHAQAKKFGFVRNDLARLERAARAKDPFFSTESARSPVFAPLAGNARYQTLLRSIGL